MFVVFPFTGSETSRRPDLSIIAPGRCAARMPGTGPLRRSSGPAREKAIVGKSRVEPDQCQRPSFVFPVFSNYGLMPPASLGGRLQEVPQLNLALLSKRFHVQVSRALKPAFVDLHGQGPQQTQGTGFIGKDPDHLGAAL
jgi:hypothetical protein